MINPDELLFSVDEHNNPIPPQQRALSHQTGIWHRSCHIWIINDDQQILCQQRSLLKDSNPGKWEPFFGGHLAPGQEYTDAAQTELAEELGLQITAEQLHFFVEYKHLPGTEFQGVFVLRWNGDSASLTLEEDEVETIAWRSINDVGQHTTNANDEQWSHMGYERALLDWLQANPDLSPDH